MPQGKLTEKELPKAVGNGAWTKAVKATVDGLKSGKIEDTETHYRTPQGTYTPERIELHARIMKLLFQGAGAHPQDKRAVFMAGGPASGKSFLLDKGVVKPPNDAVDINPDIVKSMLPEYQALIAAGDPRASSKVHEESSHIAAWAMRLAVARQHHVVIDGVGNSGPGKFRSKIEAALGHGYNVEVNYATVPTDEAIRRSNARGEKTGRFVPEGYLRSAHAGVSQVFNDDVSKLGGITIRVVDNQGKKPRVIYEKFPTGAGSVKDKKTFAAFTGKAGEAKPNA